MELFVLAALLGLGLSFGSFINALVWRLRNKRDFVRERSECVRCHHKLTAKDLIPVVSWLSLKGKCRYCKKSISWQYPLVEVLTAALFVGSYLVWPYDAASVVGGGLFGLWLVILVLLIALAVYDARWSLLPDKLVFPLMGVGFVYGLIEAVAVSELAGVDLVARFGFALLPIAGLYWVLYTVSGGKWVGYGDVKLGVAMGLIASWPLTLLTLMLANLIGVLVILPGLISKRLTRTSRVPFGPFLIVGFIIAILFGVPIIDWYIGQFIFV